MSNNRDNTEYSPQSGIQFLPKTYKGCCEDSNTETTIPTNEDIVSNTQFLNYSMYNFLNRIFMGDIPPNVFDRIQFKNHFIGEKVPIKIIQIKKSKNSSGGNNDC